jgi:hypothetical protein
MKRLMLAIGIAALMTTAPALAKKKTKPPASAQANKKKDADKTPPPNDKGTNEGAQGRINATEGAAQGADSPQFEHRP